MGGMQATANRGRTAGVTRPEEVLAAVVALLDRLGIAYHVGGSFASSFHGVPRMTADLDLVIDPMPDQMEPLAAGLERMFYIDRAAMAAALREQRSFNAILMDGTFKVDFFIRGTRDYDREEFRRAQAHGLGEGNAIRVRLKSAEDLVLRKLEWYRAGAEVSDRQWQDVVGVLRVSGPGLDWRYVEQWAARLGLRDLLERARAEADAPGG